MHYRRRMKNVPFRKLRLEVLESRRLFTTVNFARFQQATADSSVGGSFAHEAVDGIVSNDSRWASDDTGPHWLEVNLSAPYQVGSAHLYFGLDNTVPLASFQIQYFSGGSWVTAAGVSNNTDTEVKVPFASPISGATRFRVYTTQVNARIKEFVLLPPGDHPLGTGVNLNLASVTAPTVSSINAGNFGINATDGWVDDNSRWLAENSAGPHTMDVRLLSPHLVGSIHLYSGVSSGGNVVSPLSAFTIEYANDTSGWLPIAGGSVSSGTMVGNAISGNTSGAVVVNFATPVTATNIRIGFTTPYGRIRELVVLPANNASDGSIGYPIGTSVNIAPKPTTIFDTYGDGYFRINSRLNNNSLVSSATGSSQVAGTTTGRLIRYQLLYSYALNAYRIVAQDSGLALEVEGASTAAGASVVEGDYSASPHQLWQLSATDSGFFQIVNVWSGMALDLDTSGASPTITQQVRDTNVDPADRQEWKPVFLDNYFKKGTGGWVGQYGTGWAYNWGTNTTAAQNSGDFFFVPMQWGGGQENLDSLPSRYADWHNNGQPSFLLGFNEPDKADQSNMTVERAVELWPQLVQVDLPLVSPANATGGEAWLQTFSDNVDALGYRVDYTGMHWYAPPNVNTLLSKIDDVQSKGNGRPVWLTEFSVIDWSNGSGDWSEEESYNFILEFLWRAEAKANLEKYAVFLWTGDSPTNPWDLSNPRSNFFLTNGTPTPFGKAYAAWKGDAAVRNETPYVLHNRGAAHRLRNDGGSSLRTSTIRTEDPTVQWTLRDAGAGKKHIVSGQDGRLLQYNGTTLSFAPIGTTGTNVEWTLNQEQYGWFNIVHAQSGKYLQLNRTNNASNAPTSLTYSMVAASAASTMTDWWFVNPYAPVSDVGPITDSSAAANQVNENSPMGTTVGITASAVDPDAGQTVSYSLTDNAGGRFAIHPATGVVTVAGPLDFETGTSHSITILATGSDGSTSSGVFSIGVLNVADATVANRAIFYNRSTSPVFGDGSGNPLNAIDSTKQALLPGQTATFANVSNYVRGLNGVLLDIAGVGGPVTAADFQFAISNGGSPLTFTTLVATPTVSVIPNAGLAGSTRIKIEFADNAIRNTWLRATAVANANTGLPTNEVFYFGSAVGEMNIGNPAGPPVVLRTNATDTANVRQNQSPNQNSVGIGSAHDLNKDGRVNASDTALVRQNQSPTGSITLFTAPVSLQFSLPDSEPISSSLSIDSAMVDTSWLESMDAIQNKKRFTTRG